MPNGGREIVQGKVQAERERARRVIIGIALNSILWLFVDVWFVWPEFHVLALWVFLGSIAIQIVAVLPIRHATIRYSAATLVLLLGIVGQRFLLPTEIEFHGWLVPGTESSPPNHCPLSTDGMEIYFGNAAVCEATEIDGEFPIIRVHGNKLLSFIRTTEGRLTLSATIFDENGIVAEIDRGEFAINRDQAFKMKHPDSHTLVVYDNWGVPVIDVEFLNPDAVVITGRFFDRNFGTIEADSDFLFVPHLGRYHAHHCLIGIKACIVVPPLKNAGGPTAPHQIG